MRWLVLGVMLAVAAPSRAFADPQNAPQLVHAPPPPDLADADEARSERATGIGLFAGGLAVTIVSQVLTGVAIGFSMCPDPADGGCASHPDLSSYIIGAAVSTVAGNAMLATGLALWGIGNHRLKKARLAGLALAPSRDGATASLSFRF